MTMIATRSAQDSRWGGGTARTSPPGAAAGPAPTANTPVVQASLTSLHPPYAAAGSTATRFPRSVAWRASWRHCCCPAASASRAKTNPRTSRAHSQLQPCTRKIATTRGTPAASSGTGALADPQQAWQRPAARHSIRRELSLGLAGGMHVSATAWLAWWRLVLVPQVMQQQRGQFPR